MAFHRLFFLAVFKCDSSPPDTDSSDSVMDVVLIAGIVMGSISLAGVGWLAIRRCWKRQVSAKTQELVL